MGACLAMLVRFGESAKGACDDSMWSDRQDSYGDACADYKLEI